MDEELFEANVILLSNFIVNDLIPVIGLGTYPLNELILMTAAVHRIRPTHVIEWGTNIGKSARIFYETAKKYNIDLEIHSVDLPDEVGHTEHPHEFRGHLVKGCNSVHLHYGDGLDIGTKIAEQNPSARILFFVDGDHTYESVHREVTHLIEKFPEQNILVHDTFYQCPKSGYNVGPFKAVQDALTKIPNTYKTLSLNIGGPGMTLLYHLPAIDHKLLNIEWV